MGADMKMGTEDSSSRSKLDAEGRRIAMSSARSVVR
jgi:hypothetical protein